MQLLTKKIERREWWGEWVTEERRPDPDVLRDLDDVSNLILSERERHTSPLEWLEYPALFCEHMRAAGAFIAGEEDRREGTDAS